MTCRCFCKPARANLECWSNNKGELSLEHVVIMDCGLLQEEWQKEGLGKEMLLQSISASDELVLK